MFYFAWIILTAIGILASIAVFIWAIKSGQFSEQDRARYLPLADEHFQMMTETPFRRGMEVAALILVVVLVLGAMVTAVVMTVIRVYGQV